MKVTKKDAKAFAESHRIEGGDGWQLMADFANSAIEKSEERRARQETAEQIKRGKLNGESLHR